MRDACARQLRQNRSDFEIIGSLSFVTTAPPSGSPSNALPTTWYHDGHSGFTIGQLASGYAGFVAPPTGAPNIVVAMAGTNDIANGRTRPLFWRTPASSSS
jgi:hypothetical protein